MTRPDSASDGKKSCFGQFMGGAMDATTDFAQCIGIQGHDFPARIVAAHGTLRDCIRIGITKLRHDHGTVADLVIGIARHKIKAVHAATIGFGDDFHL